MPLLQFLLPGSCHDFPQCGTVTWECKQNKPFRFLVMVFYHSDTYLRHEFNTLSKYCPLLTRLLVVEVVTVTTYG